IDDMKDSFYKKIELVYNKFHKYVYNMKILLGDFNAKVGREGIFKPAMGNEISIVNYAKSKKYYCQKYDLSHHNMYEFTWTSRDGKTHNQIDHILIEILKYKLDLVRVQRRHSSILDVRSFRAADCDTDHYLLVANVRE
ncbi:hypothetical protein B7P43_G08801, partial [Cryptotermes secundus]